MPVAMTVTSVTSADLLPVIVPPCPDVFGPKPPKLRSGATVSLVAVRDVGAKVTPPFVGVTVMDPWGRAEVVSPTLQAPVLETVTVWDVSPVTARLKVSPRRPVPDTVNVVLALAKAMLMFSVGRALSAHVCPWWPTGSWG